MTRTLRNKHPYSFDFKTKPGKVIVRYLRYRYFHRCQYVVIVALCLLFLAASLISVYPLGGDYILAVIVMTIILLSVLSVPWFWYVNRENKKLVESIIFPIIDKRLNTCAKMYPQKYSVVKRVLLKDSKFVNGNKTNDLKVLVAFSNGEVCEYPFKFITSERKDGIYVRELSLTNYVCTNKREIETYSKKQGATSTRNYAVLLSAIILFIGVAIMIPSFILINSPEGINKFAFTLIGTIMLFSIASYLGNRFNNNHSKFKILGTIFEIPATIIILAIRLVVPALAILMDIIIMLSFTFLPIIVVFRFLEIYASFPISSQTATFITLAIGSFLLVYCPKYVRNAIYKTTVALDFHERSFKRKVADFMVYAYDANAIKFIFNCAYVAFVGAICINHFQNETYLFGQDTDEAIMNAFVIFLAFEGIKASYKDVKISAIAFFEKLIKVIVE